MMLTEEYLCSVCGETYTDNRVFIGHSEEICEDCYSDRYFTCANCGRVRTDNRVFTQNYYCPNCGDYENDE